MENKYSYVFIGAGPANLAAVNILLENGISNILVLEKGNMLSSRKCPGTSQKTCLNCSANCNVLSGSGGASAIFGNKLCHFPASNRVLDLFQPSELSNIDNFINTLVRSENNAFKYDQSSNSLFKKRYSAEILFRKEYLEIMNNLLSLPNKKRIILNNMTVNRINPDTKGGFAISCSDGSIFTTENVVIGVGREGSSFLRSILPKLGIQTQENKCDIGIRIESQTDNFTNDFFYQNDPKYKYYHDLGSARTFCTCKDGVIVPARLNNSFFCDGAFETTKSNLTNVALMARSNSIIDQASIETWCKSVNQKGSLLLGQLKLSDIIEGKAVDLIFDMLPEWPTKDHKEIINHLLSQFFDKKNNFININSDVNSIFNVYGPAIDNYWPVPEVNKNFQTSARGIYIIGDSVGVSRGIIQALVSGTAWSNIEIKSTMNQQVR